MAVDLSKVMNLADGKEIYKDLRKRLVDYALLVDLATKANVDNPTFTGALSRGRIPGTLIGDGSFAFGNFVAAVGDLSAAFGSGTFVNGYASLGVGAGVTVNGNNAFAAGGGVRANGDYSTAVGAGCVASGNAAMAQGGGTIAAGTNSHAEGGGTEANGDCSHTEGIGTIANGAGQHVFGKFNIPEIVPVFTEWVSGTEYDVGACVKVTIVYGPDDESVTKYICIEANSDETFDSSKWEIFEGLLKYAEIVGGGSGSSNRKNIRTLDWDGNEELAGSLKIFAGTNAERDIANGVYSVSLNNRTSAFEIENGVLKLLVSNGLTVGIDSNNKYNITIDAATATDVKSEASFDKVLTVGVLRQLVFYALARIAGDQTQRLSQNSVGDYTDAAKHDIQNMLGFENIFGTYEKTLSTKAYAIGETFIAEGKRYKATAAIAIGDTITPGTNCELDPLDGSYVKKTDYANSNNAGVVKIRAAYGIDVDGNTGELKTFPAGNMPIKTGTDSLKPIVPLRQHESVYYGLAKAAGADMASASGETVGVYPDDAKQAIQKMLGLDGLFGTYQFGAIAGKAYAVGETFIMDGKRYKVTTAISDGGLITVGTNCELDPLDGRYVKDTDYATTSKAGLATCSPTNSYGINIVNDAGASGDIRIKAASSDGIKGGTQNYQPIVPNKQHESIFYGLSKLAGVDLKNETVTVGTYPETSKAAIQSMLGVSTGAILIENVSGGTPTLTCLPNVRYKCGEVSTLSITPPASGSCEVIFESGSTATLLTVPNTVKFPPWFDATALETSTIYDIIITDGVYGAVMSWAS